LKIQSSQKDCRFSQRPGADPAGNFQVRFRDLRIRSTNLKFSPPDDIFVVNLVPNTVSPQEKKNGCILLWDGKTTKGWSAAYEKTFPRQGWQIKDGELTIIPPGSSGSSKNQHILTKKKYGAFELKFDFKLTAGANSGVKYFVNDSDKSKGSASSSLEYQIVDDASIDAAELKRLLGSLADIKAAQKRGTTKRTGEWNQGDKGTLPNIVQYF
jgi:hypothetical protein